MADNCPYWKNTKCAPPNLDQGHSCSWESRDYENCAVYKIALVKAAGGSIEDQLRASGAINMFEDFQFQTGLLENQIFQLYKQGKYGEAIPLAVEVCQLTDQQFGRCPEYAITVNTLAQLCKLAGQLENAEALFQQVLQIRWDTLGETHPDYADSLSNLADIYYSTRRYLEGEKLLLEAIEITQEALGADHPSVATKLNNLAMMHQGRAEYGLAEPLMRKALEIRRAVLGEQHPEFAISLNNLALLNKKLGKYKEAEQAYLQAVEIQRLASGEKHPDFAQALANLAVLYSDIGNYLLAERFYHQVIAVQQETLGENHPNLAKTQNNLASLYLLMSNFAAAENLYLHSLEVKCQNSMEAHPSFAITLDNLASVYRVMGNYSKAESLSRRALETWRAVLGERHPDYAISLNNLASLYELMGDLVTAETLYKESKEIQSAAFGEGHADFARCLNNLANLKKATGSYSEAAEQYQQAISIQRKVFGNHHPEVTAILGNFAELCGRMGLYKEAIRLQEEVLESDRAFFGEDHPSFALNLNNLAFSYCALGNLSQAAVMFQQSLEVRQIKFGEKHSSYAESLNNLAAVYTATNRERDALSLMQQVAGVHDLLIGKVLSLGSENQRLAYLKTIHWNLRSLLSLIVLHFPTSKEALAIACELVLRRKAIGAEALASQRDAVLGGKYPTLQPKLHELTMLRMQIAQKTLTGPGTEGLPTHTELLSEWNTQKEKLEAELARQIPEMNLEQKLRAVDRQVVALALPAGATLVEFVRFDVFDFKAIPARGEAQWKPARYLAFVMPAGEPDNLRMIDLGAAEPIDRMIATFRDAIMDEAESRGLGAKPRAPLRDDAGNEADRAGRALRAALFDPLRDALGNRQRLLLAPDGDLTRLPFEVLPTDDGRRLIDDYQISYLGAGRDVLRWGAAVSGQPSAPVVAADPDFDLGSNGAREPDAEAGVRGRRSRDVSWSAQPFGELEGTRVEGERIAAMLGVQPWLKGAALEKRIKECRSPRILHLATHGFFLSDQARNLNKDARGLGAFGSLGNQQFAAPGMENPLLRSGLALAGANWKNKGFTPPPDAEDGLLTAEDVSGLDLLATELVVLSACETGLGEIHVGEGVFGLRRAFVLAGAKTLVMSLWKVPDEATCELMEDFYRRILAYEGRAEALRQAQLALKQKYPEPYYWGAFICQGEPGPFNINFEDQTA